MSGKILGLAVMAALVVFAPQAEARRLFWWESQPRQYDTVDPRDPTDGSYDPYVDGQDMSAADMFNQDQYDRYQREMYWRHHYKPSGDRYDPALYDQTYDGGLADPANPSYNEMQPKVSKPAKPKKLKTVKAVVAKPAVDGTAPVTTATTTTSKPVVDTTTTATSTPAKTPAPVTTASVDATKPVTDTPKPAKGGKVTCEKGEEIVASYGFLDISQKTCDGTSLVYSAVRGKSNFEVEVNPANGEVTAVRKTS